MTEHHDSLSTLKSTFRADLEQAQARHRAPAPRRRRARVLRVAGVSGAAVLTASALILGIGGGPAERLDIVAQAQAALAPKPGILHVRARMFSEFSVDGKPISFQGEGPPAEGVLIEHWSATEPGRWHTIHREPTPSGGTHIVSEHAHLAGGSGRRDDVGKWYLARDGATEVITRLPSKYGDQPSGLRWGPNGDERLEDLRQMLAAGTLKDRGPAAVGGRPVRKLVGITRYPDAPSTIFEYFVDAQTFAPVRVIQHWRMQATLKDEPPRMQSETSRIDFELYEHLPANAETERLLDFVPPAGTDVTTRRYQENPRAAAKRHARDGLDADEARVLGR